MPSICYPIKSFELGLYNKPIIVGAKGYAAEFLKREIPNASLFQPCNGRNALKVLMKATKRKNNQRNKNKKRDLLLKNIIVKILQKNLLK